MKKILITGANSYIGTSFINWVEKKNLTYVIDELDMRNSAWLETDFSQYDCVLHLAAIVHKKGVDESIYYTVNRDLAIQTAQKAKSDGVKQFIFFSTMSVYGKEYGVIDVNTKENPVNAYGLSKLEAEEGIIMLQDTDFSVAVLRPPMIYGKNAPGNYARLSKLANKTPFFPNVSNQRSMLYIENLHAFVKIVIDNNLSGEFYPQNEELVNTSILVKTIANQNSKPLVLITGFSKCILFFVGKIGIISKLFGSLYYDNTMQGFPNSIKEDTIFSYQEKNFSDSILESEK
jgi:UDP-glucose 4-epimerase